MKRRRLGIYFISFPSSGLGTHLDAKLQLGKRNVTDGLPAVKQSRALQPSEVPKQELGNQKKKMAKLVVDASFLISAIRSCDANHQQCFQFFREHENVTWIIPTIAYFEYQAAQSRLRREGKKAYRELYIPNFKVYELTHDFIKQVAEMDLAESFRAPKGCRSCLCLRGQGREDSTGDMRWALRTVLC